MNQNIRTLQKTCEDYRELARLFNTFKNSGSWPDGFGGDLVFNENLMKKWYENKDLSAHFIITAPGDSSKIVGVCFCNKSYNLPDAWYVDLLGVEPAYQGRKLGKALLLHATEMVRQKKVRLLSLGTWPGNLKAMPLYKRQGYRWRPKTHVFMENYIPPILNYPLFANFFKDKFWYDLYRPVIDQEENREYRDKMTVYSYVFRVDEENNLEVLVDRSIGRICGFTLKENSQRISAWVSLQDSEVFTGVQQVHVVLHLQNKGQEPAEVKVSSGCSKELHLTGEHDLALILEPGEEKDVTYQLEVSHEAAPIDPEEMPETYSTLEAEFRLKWNDKEFSLSAGVIPRRALNIRKAPGIHDLQAGMMAMLHLNIINTLNKEQKVHIVITEGMYMKLEKKEWDLIIHPLDTAMDIPVQVENCETGTDELTVQIELDNGKIACEKKIPYAIFHNPGVVSYEVGSRIYIENRNLRIVLHRLASPGSNTIILFDKMQEQTLPGCIPFLGYPMVSEGSEFLTRDFSHTLIKQDQGIILESKASSTVKSGIVIYRQIFVPGKGRVVRITYELENSSTQTVKDLGIQISVWFWANSHSMILGTIYPCRQGIIENRMKEITCEPVNDPKIYTEGWAVVKTLRGYMGFIYDLSGTKKLSISKKNFAFEQKMKDIKPGEKCKSAAVYICFSNNWYDARQLWQEYYAQNFTGHQRDVSLLQADTVCGISGPGNENKSFKCLMLDKNTKEFRCLFTAVRKAGLKGTLTLDFKDLDLIPVEFRLPEEERELWQEKVRLNNPPVHRIYKGSLKYDSTCRIYNYPVGLIFYDSKKQITLNKGSINGKTYIECDNGFLKFRGSKDYMATLTQLSPCDDSKNYLFSFFPEIKPFCWDNKFFGGIEPRLFEYGSWNKMKFQESVFEQREIFSQLWKGFGFISNIQQHPGSIKGLQICIDYITLPDAPFLVVRMKIINQSKAARRFDTQLSYYHNTSQSTGDVYYIPEKNEINTYRLRDYEGKFNQCRDTLWNAFKAADKKYTVGHFLYRKSDNELAGIYPLNLKLCETSTLFQNNLIKAGKSRVFYSFIVLSKDVKSFSAFAESNLEQLLPDLPDH